MNEETPIRCVVVDDEHLAVKLIADYVSKTPGLSLVLQTTKVTDALPLVQQGGVDLLFLDIQMPEINGIQFMKIIGSSCKVILTTAYENYAVESYEHDIVDYLLKPITFDRFLLAIKKTRQRLAQNPADKKPPDYIFIKVSHRIQRVDLVDIHYIEALKDYIAIYTKDAKILTLESMKNMEGLLPGEQFTRIHKSYIINKKKINFLSRNKIVVNNVYLPVGETYREKLMQELGL